MQRIKRSSYLLVAAVAAAALIAPPAQAAPMEVTQLSNHLCKVVHGGRFVGIPGFPGEKIDRRLLPDIHWMKRKFHIFITDGYSTDPVHSANGEHPIGLATDIIPYASKGGSWHDVGQLAKLTEPQQNAPIMPWRWVGYDGDSGHGRGNHLHLSWAHSPTEPRNPARTVYTRHCPDPANSDGGGDGGDGTGTHRHRDRDRRNHDGPSGGVGTNGGGSGGVGSGKASTPFIGNLAPIVPEQ